MSVRWLRRRDLGFGNPEGRVLLAVSGVIDAAVVEQVDRGERPVPDYVELARAMDADVVDVAEARRRGGWIGRLIERVGGAGPLVGWAAFRSRRRYDAIFTDGEHVGMPLALLSRLSLSRPIPHVMIAHYMRGSVKRLGFKLFRLGRFVDTMIVYSAAQERIITKELGYPASRVVMSSYTVDTRFFAPDAVAVDPDREPMICTAGLECRDYPTLIRAVDGLPVRVIIAAASPWSRRTDSTEGVPIPNTVEVCKLSLHELRQRYADADLVVVPLEDVDFQAGITTILEAMAMGKTVICSRTRGQRDTISDGVTGIYVPPGDVAALRRAIDDLLADPERAARIGAAARAQVSSYADVRDYADRLAGLVDEATRRHRPSSTVTLPMPAAEGPGVRHDSVA